MAPLPPGLGLASAARAGPHRTAAEADGDPAVSSTAARSPAPRCLGDQGEMRLQRAGRAPLPKAAAAR